MEGHVRLAVAAQRLGVGRTTVRGWFDDGLLRGRAMFARGDRVIEEASIEEVIALLRMPRGPEREAALDALREHNRALRG